jgi:hypothetical protein
MSFTEDELQAFNAVLEKRFTAHRQEMEQSLDQRLSTLRQEIEQQLTTLRTETASTLKQELASLRGEHETNLVERLSERQKQLSQALTQEAEQKFQQIETAVDRMLAAQLLGIEQLLNQHALKQQGTNALPQGLPSQLEAIEVQTELPWDDLVNAMGKALDERLIALDTSLQRSVKDLEHYLTTRLHHLRDEIAHSHAHGQPYGGQSSNGTLIQDVLAGIEHLERVIESMQVAMTANHALLSNRLYHHQQLPLERAHPVSRPQVTSTEEAPSLLAQAKERVASGLDPEIAPQPSASEESAGQS